jgi:hypothetical protein
MKYNAYIYSSHMQGYIWTEGGTTPPLAHKFKKIPGFHWLIYYI